MVAELIVAPQSQDNVYDQFLQLQKNISKVMNEIKQNTTFAFSMESTGGRFYVLAHILLQYLC